MKKARLRPLMGRRQVRQFTDDEFAAASFPDMEVMLVGLLEYVIPGCTNQRAAELLAAYELGNLEVRVELQALLPRLPWQAFERKLRESNSGQ